MEDRLKLFQVIDWTPPSHSEAFDILVRLSTHARPLDANEKPSSQFQVFTADGGSDIHKTLSLAGEPPVPELEMSYGKKATDAFTITDHWALQVRKRDYQQRYLEYWQSTAARSQTGRVVDAVILPVAPSASVRPGQGRYFGYTAVANVLDYPSVTVPVAKVDKNADARDASSEHVPCSEMD